MEPLDRLLQEVRACMLCAALPDIRLTLLVGGYAQAYYLGLQAKPTLVATVHSFREYLPEFLPLPHPHPP